MRATLMATTARHARRHQPTPAHERPRPRDWENKAQQRTASDTFESEEQPGAIQT
jgi:hypothetical protein